mmetsp:Transcript_17638/g.33168  ORF Transcript_17638/g.33168 Transcript_17638/m.33168 type:complete len:295 (-) Transcript_17638:71-955(-)
MIHKTDFLFVFTILFGTTNGWLTIRPFGATRTTRAPSSNKKDSPCVSPSTALPASKFSQPAFSQPAFAGGKDKKPQQHQQKQHRAPRKFGADSKIASLHAERVKTAGRVGTKRYVDPCKVFLGNLPFNITEKVLEQWLEERMGMPAPLLLQQVKVIRDWKTGKSKGYGFAIFTESIHATVCIEKCNGQQLDGRPLSVNQGKKKDTATIMVKKKKKAPLDAEEAAIQAGMEEASRRMDPQEALMLRQLDPDLVDDDEFENDEGLFDDDDDDDDTPGVVVVVMTVILIWCMVILIA